MYINRKLLENIAKHFMTAKERAVKIQLCKLLNDKGHNLYARRFFDLDFNIVDSKTHPEFTAAISFEEATVYLSDGFLGSGEAVFNQLDVLLRHELAHNLMMHQIRMLYEFKAAHSQNPEEAGKHLNCSASLHRLENYLGDFEISNRRYTNEDKKIVKAMMLNGKLISGLVTEDHRSSWKDMSLEEMYKELSAEIIRINSEIRSLPGWKPIKDNTFDEYDQLKDEYSQVISLYADYMSPSRIKAPLDVFIKSAPFKQYSDVFKEIITSIYESLKDNSETDADKAKILELAETISLLSPQEMFDIVNPFTGEIICTLYTPEDKAMAVDALKNMGGNINYNPSKFNIKRKTNSQEYKDAWNKVVAELDKKKFSDQDLEELAAAIEAL